MTTPHQQDELAAALDENTMNEELAALITLTRQPFLQTWDAIGYDLYAIDAEMTNDVAVECVLDANRMKMYGGEDGPAADVLVSEACAKFGWEKVFAAYQNHFNLA